MEKKTVCVECGNDITSNNYALECEYCLSKKVE